MTPHVKTIKIQFLVVEALFGYNGIINQALESTQGGDVNIRDNDEVPIEFGIREV